MCCQHEEETHSCLTNVIDFSPSVLEKDSASFQHLVQQKQQVQHFSGKFNYFFLSALYAGCTQVDVLSFTEPLPYRFKKKKKKSSLGGQDIFFFFFCQSSSHFHHQGPGCEI